MRRITFRVRSKNSSRTHETTDGVRNNRPATPVSFGKALGFDGPDLALASGFGLAFLNDTIGLEC